MIRALVAMLTLSCVLVSFDARASDSDSDPLGDYTVTTWNDKEGLPAGRIRAIEQDSDGYLWLGTDVGLVRFDGVRFTAWTTPLSTGVPITGVNALMSARDGSLWIGINERGVIRNQHGASTVYDERDGFPRSFVFALAEDHQGAVWAGTLQGLYRFSHQRWERIGSGRGLVDGAVLAVYEDSAQRLWIATPTAIYRRIDPSSSFTRIDDIELSNTSQHFSEDSDGGIWITDFQRGFRPAYPSAREHPQGARHGWGAHLLHDHRGNFWVATLGQGLWRVKTGPARSTTVETITVRNGLSSDAVQTMVEDREGNLWVGTRAGLQRLSPRRVTRLIDLPIPRALETSPDGSVWVGTASGLMRFSAAGRQLYGERDGLPGSVVLALHARSRRHAVGGVGARSHQVPARAFLASAGSARQPDRAHLCDYELGRVGMVSRFLPRVVPVAGRRLRQSRRYAGRPAGATPGRARRSCRQRLDRLGGRQARRPASQRRVRAVRTGPRRHSHHSRRRRRRAVGRR